jgi:3-ketosteroid 9alpha-monooxygenase subunit A
MARYPHPIPFGWFQVCWPDEVPDGGTYRTFNLGTTLTVTRRGERFTTTDADGRDWPTEVRNGLVVMWWHPQRAEPSFALPELPEFSGHPDFSAPIRRHHPRIRAFWQELGETAADVAHIQAHLVEFGLSMDDDGTVSGEMGGSRPPEVVETSWDGPHGWMRLSQPFPTPKGPVAGHIDTDSYGPGMSITWFKGLLDTGLLGCNIPIDAETTEIRFTYVVRTKGGEWDVSDNLAHAFVNEIDRLAVDDLEIWEHKAYLTKPSLAAGDGPILRFRRWAEQFYVGAA